MNHLKLLKTISASTLIASPVVPIISSLSGCSKINYFQIAKRFKQYAIDEFIQLSKCRRQTWQESEAFDFVKNTMHELGYEPAGEDNFGSTDAAIVAAKADLGESKYNPNLNKYGNIWFDIPANLPSTAKKEDYPKVILHAHLDCQMSFLNESAENDWNQHGIECYYDQDQQIIYANGYKTSLGADNGVGCACLLSIAKFAKDSDFTHGELRLLFTCDESGTTPPGSESGAGCESGAGYLKFDQQKEETSTFKKPFDTKYVLDLDGYQQSYIVRSCAGFHECIFNKNDVEDEEIDWTNTNAHEYELTVSIFRSQGANSGTDANKGYGNALWFLMSTVIEWNDQTAADKQLFKLISTECEGGAYSICPKATARFISCLTPTEILKKCEKFTQMFETQFPAEVGKIHLVPIEKTGNDRSKYAFNNKDSLKISYLVTHLACGPISWIDPTSKTQVKTSFNVGPLSINAPQDGSSGTLNYHCVFRSSDYVEQEIFKDTVHSLFNFYYSDDDLKKELSDIICTLWEPDDNNAMANYVYSIEKKFKYSPINFNIHSWSEISQFGTIISDFGLGKAQMASIGPTITGTHSRQETLWVNTVDSFLKTIVYCLMNMNEIPK